MRFGEKHLKQIVIGAIVLVCLVAIIWSAYHPSIGFPSRVLSRVVYPIQTTLARANVWVIDVIDTIQGFMDLEEENRLLKEQSLELNRLQSRIIALERENAFLRGALNYQRTVSERDLKVARVIGRDPSSWLHMIVIDVGGADGVQIGMSVVAVQGQNEGLVGRIVEVSHRSAKVLLIIDPEKSNATAAFVEGGEDTQETTWHQGIVEGSTRYAGVAELMYVPHEAQIKEGGLVLTSGLGGNYIPYLTIGTVEEIVVEGYGLLQRALVRPHINFNRLYEVMVIMSPVPYPSYEGPAS